MNQLKLFLGATAVALLAACNSRPANGYSVTGQVEGIDGEEVYLLHMFSADSSAVDTAVIVNGTFEFKGVTEIPTRAIIYRGSLYDRANKTVAQFYLDPADITVTNLQADNFTEAVFNGSKTTDDRNAFEAKQKAIANQIAPLREAIQMNSENKEIVDSLNRKIDDILEQMHNLDLDFIKENPGSFYVPARLEMAMTKMDYEDLKATFEALTPEVQAAAGEVKAQIIALAAVQPGQPAPDLVGVNQNGEPTKLSDLKGNVVLVDFWATWCGPCRASLPHINELYKKYHDKGFEVFCVGDNDSNPDQWKEFIETSKDGMQNYHHILRGLKMTTDAEGNFTGYDRSNDQSDKYVVHFLPTKYLIAADGTIIGKFDDSDAMDAKLAEIFE